MMSLDPRALKLASKSCKLSSKKLNLFVPTLHDQTAHLLGLAASDFWTQDGLDRLDSLAVTSEPWVKHEHRVQMLASFEGFKQRRVVVQTQALRRNDCLSAG